MTELEMPDGSVIEFPDGTPTEVMKTAAAKLMGKPAAGPKQDFRGSGPGAGTALEAGLIGARQGVTFGFGDEMNAGVRAAGDWLGGQPFGEAYDKRLAHERGLLAQTRRENPIASTVGEVAGAAVIPLGAGTSVVRGTIAGGLGGAAYGFGSGEGGAGERLESAGVGGAVGAAAGAAAPFVLRVAQKAANNRATRRAVRAAAQDAPDPSMLRQEARALYKGMEQRGVSFNDDAGARLLGGLVEDLQGFDSDVAPMTMRKVGALADKVEHGLSLSGLMNTREVLGKVAMNPTSDGAAAKAALRRIDGFMDDLLDADTIGDAAGLTEDWKQARALWKRFKNSERLTEAMDRAKDAASGYENGLRVEFRKLRNNKKAWAALSREERQVVLEVVRGSPVGNALRRFAGWGGGEGQQRNLLNATAGMGVGYAVGNTIGGPIGGALGAGAVLGAGKLAARGSEAATEAAAQRALNFVANGGRFPRPEPLMLPMTQNALEAMSRGSVPPGLNALMSQEGR